MPYKTIKIILILIPIVGFVWLVNKNLAFSGQLTVKYDFSKKSAFISELYPNSRVSSVQRDEQGEYFQALTSHPVYFDLKMPRTFNQAEIIIKYKNSDNPIFEIGAKAGPAEDQFDLKPVENQILDRLIEDKTGWSAIGHQETVLIQKNYAGQNFETVDHFLNDLPESNLAVYHYNLIQNFKIPDYQKSAGRTIIDKSIRGPHQIFTYIKDEPLDFKLIVQDINRHDNPDPLKIIVSYQDKIIYQFDLEDDGYVTGTDPATEAREVSLYLDDLAEGVYKIDLQTNDDIFFRQIDTAQRLLVFKNRLYLTDSPEYADGLAGLNTEPTTVYATTNKIVAQTSHQASRQTLTIAGQELVIDQAHRKFSFKPDRSLAARDEIYPITSSKNDILMIYNGFMAFSREAFFEPLPPAIDEATDIERQEINYILADYQPPTVADGYKTASIKFDLTRHFVVDKKLRFVFSGRDIQIHEIEVRLKGQPVNLKTIRDRLFQN